MSVDGASTLHTTVRKFLENPVKVVLLAISENKVDFLLDTLYEESVSFYHLADLIRLEVFRRVELGIYLAEKGYGIWDDWRSGLEKEGFKSIELGFLGLKALSIARETSKRKKILDKVRGALRNEKVAGKVEQELTEWASKELSDIIKLVYERRDE